MDYERIDIDPDVMFGKPVIKGTRITVEQILRKLAAGLSDEEIRRDHPHVEQKDIQQALEFAADRLGNEEVTLMDEDDR